MRGSPAGAGRPEIRVFGMTNEQLLVRTCIGMETGGFPKKASAVLREIKKRSTAGIPDPVILIWRLIPPQLGVDIFLPCCQTGSSLPIGPHSFHIGCRAPSASPF